MRGGSSLQKKKKKKNNEFKDELRAYTYISLLVAILCCSFSLTTRHMAISLLTHITNYLTITVSHSCCI